MVNVKYRWEAVNRYHTARKALEKATSDYASLKKTLETDMQEASNNIAMHDNGLHLELIEEAEKILYVRGDVLKGDDNMSCVVDAIQWFSKLDLGPYKDLETRYFGTKSYDRWYGQRTDCEYGSGPRHGHIIFSIGLRGSYQERQELVESLTDEQRDACIYYLNNLIKIQEHKNANPSPRQAY